MKWSISLGSRSDRFLLSRYDESVEYVIHVDFKPFSQNRFPCLPWHIVLPLALPLGDEIEGVLADKDVRSTHEPSDTILMSVTSCCYLSAVPKACFGRTKSRLDGPRNNSDEVTMTRSSFAAGLVVSRLLLPNQTY